MKSTTWAVHARRKQAEHDAAAATCPACRATRTKNRQLEQRLREVTELADARVRSALATARRFEVQLQAAIAKLGEL